MHPKNSFCPCQIFSNAISAELGILLIAIYNNVCSGLGRLAHILATREQNPSEDSTRKWPGGGKTPTGGEEIFCRLVTRTHTTLIYLFFMSADIIWSCAFYINKTLSTSASRAFMNTRACKKKATKKKPLTFGADPVKDADAGFLHTIWVVFAKTWTRCAQFFTGWRSTLQPLSKYFIGPHLSHWSQRSRTLPLSINSTRLVWRVAPAELFSWHPNGILTMPEKKRHLPLLNSSIPPQAPQ